jgi:hypothetical protein
MKHRWLPPKQAKRPKDARNAIDGIQMKNAVDPKRRPDQMQQKLHGWENMITAILTVTLPPSQRTLVPIVRRQFKEAVL